MPKNDKCVACGGYDFSLIDGFMYCDRCGSLLENFEELKEEELGFQGANVGAAKIKIKKKVDEDAPKAKKKAGDAFFKASKEERQQTLAERQIEFLKNQQPRRENLPYNKTPEYLYGVGRRLFAFTEMLSKSAHILVKEMNFNPDVKTCILAVYQKYLAHCQVAFCHQEQCGNDENLRFVAIMENIHYEEEERDKKRREKLARRGKGVKALSKSAAAWTLLTQGNLTENLELESGSENEHEEENDQQEGDDESLAQNETNRDDVLDNTIADTTMGFVRKVTTALSKDALRRAGQMTLSLEIHVAILHSALLCSGYNNILISDIVCWIREDRFRIQRRSVKFLYRSLTEPGEDLRSSVETREQFLRLPLFEIIRTCTVFNQSLNLTEFQAPLSFEKIAARLIENLNLPVDILTRVLLLESIIPCEMSPLLEKQADIRMGGTDFTTLSGLHPKMLLSAFMSSLGRKETHYDKSDLDEVLLSIDTKVMAYVLMILKLTFDLDHGPLSENVECFDIDTWIHQFEMRLKCWQGHDMSMVLRPSCPIPESRVEMPFGPNFDMWNKRGIPQIRRLSRTPGFQKTVPCEMSFQSTSNMPTVFDIRENRYPEDRKLPDAILSPLKFQTRILKREMEDEPKKFEFVNQESVKTFFRDFTNFKTTEVAENFSEFFPFSSNYLQYARPDWISDCTARKSKTAATPLRFYLSNESASSILSVATPTFSPRFEFLLTNLSLLLGEHENALYCAFLMIEFQLTSAEKMEELKLKILNSEPVLVDGIAFNGTTSHLKLKFGILSEHPVEQLTDLKFFELSKQYFEHREICDSSENVEFFKIARNQEIRDELFEEDGKSNFRRIAFDFQTFFSILTLKFW